MSDAALQRAFRSQIRSPEKFLTIVADDTAGRFAFSEIFVEEFEGHYLCQLQEKRTDPFPFIPKQTFFYNAQGKRLPVGVRSSNTDFIAGRSGKILDYAGRDPLHPFPPGSSGYIVNRQDRYNIGLGEYTYRGVPGSFEHHIAVVDGHAVWAEVVPH